MAATKELFVELYSDPRFSALVKEIMRQRPVIPGHDPQKDNTEQWKATSAEQRGFDIWVTYLRVPKEATNE